MVCLGARCKRHDVGHRPSLRPVRLKRTIIALAGHEGKRFSPFEALAIWKLQKSSTMDPVAETLRAIELMYAANTEGTQQAASAAEAAKNEATSAQVCVVNHRQGYLGTV
jgi:hypothetical protein